MEFLHTDIDYSLIKLIPQEFALSKKILPFKSDANRLHVAVLKNSYSLLQQIQLITGKTVSLVEVPEADLERALSKYYNVNLTSLQNLNTSLDFKVVKKESNTFADRKTIQNDFSVVNKINELLSNAINQKISDIHFEPYDNEFRVRYRIDGRLHVVEKLDFFKRNAFISRLKIMSELDIAEKRRPQDGRIRMTSGDKVVDIRLSTMPTDFGEKIVLRILDKTAFKLDINNIGFDTNTRLKFTDKLSSPYGMILVTGPTGSGKTTTLYTALSNINKEDVNIMTIEDPIEYNLTGVNQAQVKPDIGFTFANALRSFLRQDPDVIMVGEIRDGETAEIAIRSALTGHLVLSTLHTNDAAAAVTRLIDMGVEPFLVATSLQLVMAQRLVRKICTHCKEEYKPDTGLVSKLFNGNSREIKFFRGSGCDHCSGTGFSGRTALIELLINSDKTSQQIIQNFSASEIRKTAIEEGMLTLRQHGILKLEEGVTTIEEVLRETV
jgi:type IV pilus assembly protein PilB